VTVGGRAGAVACAEGAGAQIGQAIDCIPNEGVRLTAAGGRGPHHLTGVVDVTAKAVGAAEVCDGVVTALVAAVRARTAVRMHPGTALVPQLQA
jgi:hypothetical protein